MNIKMAGVGAMTAIAALCAGTAQAGKSPVPQMSHVGVLQATQNSPDKALFNNSIDDSGIAIVSQNFESSFDVYDNQAADDFKIPAAQTWTVTEVDVTGQYFNGPGPAVSETVTFYKAKQGKPGAKLSQQTVTGVDNGTGSFKITLPSAVILGGGKYFVSVVVNMDFAVGGEWGWENRSTMGGKYAAQWKNKGDGFATGCVDWGEEDVCIASGQGPDHMFILKGTK
jgi:hypothetical protein